MNKLIRIALTFLLVMTTGVIQAEIVIYPVPQGIYYARHNDDYTVKVRQVGEKDWVDLYEYNVKVDMDTKSDATMVQFDFSGKVEVLVQKNNGEIRSAVVRPLSKGIQPEIDGNFLLFTIDKPQKLSVEFNGDRLNNLHVFANPIIKNVPDKNDPNVIYFEAGIHEPTDTAGKCFRIPSNTTVYLEGGAVLKGCLTCDSVENVKILGHGMLLEPQQGISVTYSRNVLIDGVTVVNPRHYTVSGGQSTGITIKNLKSFSYQGWSDGLDFMSCSDVMIDDVFLRNSDDCIALYTHRWNYYGDCRNIHVLNSTLWADIAHPINIGTHGNTETGDEVLEDIVFRNIDILEHDEDDRDYQGCMTINVGDHNLAQNITFEDIRVEHIQEGQLFHLRVMYNQKYNTAPGRGVKNITFRNISCTGKYINSSLIEGYDKNRKIENILFENIVLNGRRITSLEELNIDKKDFVEKISVYARVSPEHKIRIVRAWQEKGNIVAMTGDGVNDAPALKQANIGVAMGITGSEVSKDAAAMVLTDDNFATIIKAVENGRNIYQNIKNSIQFLLSGNFGAILAVLYASIAGLPVPFAPVHLLFINLLTDSLPAIALGLEPHSKEVMKQKPRPMNESILTKQYLLSIGTEGLGIGIMTMAAFLIGYRSGDAVLASTMAFGTLCTSRLVHGFNCKSSRPVLFTKRFFNNIYLIGAFLIGLVLITGVLMIPGLQGIFKVESLNIGQLLTVYGLALLNLPVVQLLKWIRNSR